MRPAFATASGDEGRFRADVTAAFAKCYARGEDIEMGVGRLILMAPGGTRYYLTATDEGVLALADAATAATASVPTVVAQTSAFVALAAGSNAFVCDTEDADYGDNFAAGIFTAPVAGVYLVTLWVELTGTSLDPSNSIGVLINGAPLDTTIVETVGTTDQYATLTALLVLAEGDTAQPRANVNGGTSVTGICRFGVRFLP